jgi:hypothetical protein
MGDMTDADCQMVILGRAGKGVVPGQRLISEPNFLTGNNVKAFGPIEHNLKHMWSEPLYPRHGCGTVIHQSVSVYIKSGYNFDVQLAEYLITFVPVTHSNVKYQEIMETAIRNPSIEQGNQNDRMRIMQKGTHASGSPAGFVKHDHLSVRRCRYKSFLINMSICS